MKITQLKNKRGRNFLLLMFLFCIAARTSFAQISSVPFYYRIGVNEFSNVNVYSLFYDNQDETLYAATNSGVYFYAQSKFTLIKSDTNSRSISYFALKQDKAGTIYCNNLQGQVFEVQKDGLKLCVEFPRESLLSNFKYFIDNQSNLVCLGSKLIEYQKENKVFKPHVLMEKTDFVSDIKQTKSGKYLIGYRTAGNGVKSDFNYVIGKENFIEIEGRILFEMSNEIFGINFSGTQMNDAKLSQYESLKDEVIIADLNYGTDNYQQLTDSSFIIMAKQKGMSIGTFSEGEYNQTHELFANDFISAAHQCENGMLLLGTFNEGVIVIPKMSYLGYESTTLHSSIKAYDHDTYVVANRSGSVYGYSIDAREAEFIFQSRVNQDGLMISASLPDSKKPWGKLVKLKDRSGQGATDLGNGDIAFLAWNGILVRSLNKTKSHFQEPMQNVNTRGDFMLSSRGRYNAIAADTINHLIYASKLGEVYKYNYEGEEIEQIGQGLNMKVSSLHYSNNLLYCGTQKKGVFVFQDDSLVEVFDEQSGWNTNQIKKVERLGDLLYVLSRNGVQVYDLEKNKFLPLGLATNIMDRKVIDISVSKNRLLVLRRKDHFSIPVADLTEVVTPSNIYVDSFLVNGERIEFSESNFSFEENSMSFFVDYRDFRTKQKTSIVYKLEGFYDNWQILDPNEHEIKFQSLPPGKFKLKVGAQFNNILNEQFAYSFEISPPFWQRWWFYFLIVFGTIVLIGGLALLRLKSLKTKARRQLELESSKSKVLDAQLKAIRAQMNPHFVFNAINSIQDLVLNQETLKSYDCLESFSRLVRITLDHSEREFVKIYEEKEFLKLYLDLESLRFSEDFEYDLDSDKGLNEFEIPSMVIQPFIENAIKHGLLHKFGEKKLSVSFSKLDEGTVQCIIEDNGVGRKRSQEINERKKMYHKSFSTHAIDSRLKLISDQIGGKFTYEIIDLYQENKAVGTRVEIIFSD